MDLKKKLILEAFEDEVASEPIEEPHEITKADLIPADDLNLTPEEEVNFCVGMVSDLLNKDLELYNLVTSLLSDNQNLNEEMRQVLESVSGDLAISIGKLQQCLKSCSDEEDGELIHKGEEEVKGIFEEDSAKEE